MQLSISHFEFPLEKYTFSWATMRPNSSGLVTFTCLYVLMIKQVKLLKKRTFKASFFSRKQLESLFTIHGESLPEVRFVIDRCRLVNQSILTRSVIGWF